MQTDPGTTSRNEARAAVNLRNPCQYGPRNERAVIALRTTQCQLLSSVCADLWLQGLGPDSDKGKALLEAPNRKPPRHACSLSSGLAVRASALASRGSILTTDIEVLVGCLTVQVQIEGHAPLSLLCICLLQSLLSFFLSLCPSLSLSLPLCLCLCLSLALFVTNATRFWGPHCENTCSCSSLGTSYCAGPS